MHGKPFAVKVAIVSTHSRPEAAGVYLAVHSPLVMVSTHSRPEAAGSGSVGIKNWVARFQLTAARRRLATKFEIKSNVEVFQLTAARRRLGHRIRPLHSATGFNSQPPGGGWLRGSPSFRG